MLFQPRRETPQCACPLEENISHFMRLFRRIRIRSNTIFFEPGIDVVTSQKENIVRAKGLALEKFDSLSSLTGHAQAIQFGEDLLKGAADPRGDGAAIGF